MGKNVVRIGDPTTHGGVVITATSTTIVEGRPVALIGDLVICPIPGHGVNPIIEGSSTCFSDGRAIVIDKCKSVCGCSVISTTTSAEME